MRVQALTNPFESPPEVNDVPRQSGVRSIAGWILIVIGLLIPLRVAWLTWWWWWPLAKAEQNRAIVLSACGILLALIGGWLRFRSTLFFEGIVVLLIVLGWIFIAREI